MAGEIHGDRTEMMNHQKHLMGNVFGAGGMSLRPEKMTGNDNELSGK